MSSIGGINSNPTTTSYVDPTQLMGDLQQIKSASTNQIQQALQMMGTLMAENNKQLAPMADAKDQLKAAKLAEAKEKLKAEESPKDPKLAGLKATVDALTASLAALPPNSIVRVPLELQLTLIKQQIQVLSHASGTKTVAPPPPPPPDPKLVALTNMAQNLKATLAMMPPGFPGRAMIELQLKGIQAQIQQIQAKNAPPPPPKTEIQHAMDSLDAHMKTMTDQQTKMMSLLTGVMDAYAGSVSGLTKSMLSRP